MGRGTTPLLIIYFMIFYKGYIPKTFFFKIPKIEILIVSKLWMFIFLEHTWAIFYNLEKDLSNGVLHAPIRNDLTPTLRGFVVGSQITNLIS
jgi:hypothetical protein